MGVQGPDDRRTLSPTRWTIFELPPVRFSGSVQSGLAFISVPDYEAERRLRQGELPFPSTVLPPVASRRQLPPAHRRTSGRICLNRDGTLCILHRSFSHPGGCGEGSRLPETEALKSPFLRGQAGICCKNYSVRNRVPKLAPGPPIATRRIAW